MLHFTIHTIPTRVIGIILTSLLMLLFIGQPTKADTGADTKKWHQVEIVIFANTHFDAIEGEHWESQKSFPTLNKMAELYLPTDIENLAATEHEKVVFFDKMDAIDLNLTGIRDKIERSRQYKLLLHTGWRQPLSKDIKPIPVFLDNNDDQRVFQTSINSEIPSTPAEHTAAEVQFLEELKRLDNPQLSQQFADTFMKKTVIPRLAGPPLTSLYGTATLRQGRYIHLSFDLFYRYPQKNSLDESKTPIPFPMQIIDTLASTKTEVAQADLFPLTSPVVLMAYRLKESRRIRTHRLFFFDHPAFGIIAKINPYHPPTPAPDTQPEQPANDAATMSNIHPILSQSME